MLMSFCCTTYPLQIERHNGHKVFNILLLHLDEVGRSHLLGEVITTDRSYMALFAPLGVLEQQLSRLYPSDPNLDAAMVSKAAIPGYTTTDRDLATLNALSKVLNGCK
jgi:hypothetical protein